MILFTESEEVSRPLSILYGLMIEFVKKHRKMTIKMTYKAIIPYFLYMPSYFLGTFTE